MRREGWQVPVEAPLPATPPRAPGAEVISGVVPRRSSGTVDLAGTGWSARSRPILRRLWPSVRPGAGVDERLAVSRSTSKRMNEREKERRPNGQPPQLAPRRRTGQAQTRRTAPRRPVGAGDRDAGDELGEVRLPAAGWA